MRSPGVLWHAGHVLSGIRETLQLLRNAKKRLFFVTNNSTKSRELYKKKFDKLGIPVEVEEIYPSVRTLA